MAVCFVLSLAVLRPNVKVFGKLRRILRGQVDLHLLLLSFHFGAETGQKATLLRLCLLLRHRSRPSGSSRRGELGKAVSRAVWSLVRPTIASTSWLLRPKVIIICFSLGSWLWLIYFCSLRHLRLRRWLGLFLGHNATALHHI